MEKFLFRPLAAGEVVDVVHEQDVDAPVFLAELQDLAVLEMVDEVVHELLGRDVEDLQPLVALLERVMADGVHEVGLAEPGPAVDVERVVGLGRVLGDGRSRRRGRTGCRCRRRSSRTCSWG